MSVALRLAATVVLRRQDGAILLMQRPLTSKFFPGAFVFPGGAVEELDRGADEMETFRRAAIRECEEEVGLSPVDLQPYSRWITPEGESARRYDTLFFVAALPKGEPCLQKSEGESLAFLQPEEVLVRFAAGTIALAPPTLVTIAELAADAPPHAGLTPIQPVMLVINDRPALVLPGDALHPKPAPRPWPGPVTTRISLDGWPKWSFL